MAFPTIADTGTANPVAAPGTTTLNIIAPSGITAGDLLVGYVTAQHNTINGTTFASPPSGYSFISTPGTPQNPRVWNSTAGATAWFYKIAAGGETNTTIEASQAPTSYVTRLMRITGHDAATPPQIDTSGGATGVTPTAVATTPTLTPTFGSEDILWLTIVGGNNGSATTVDSVPSGYTAISAAGGDKTSTAAAGSWSAAAYRQLNAASEDPGDFGITTASTRQYGAGTIAIRPSQVTNVETTLSTAEAAATGVGLTPKNIEKIVPTSIGTPYTGLTGAVGNIQDLVDSPNGLWLTGTDPSSTSGTSGLLRPTSHAAVSGFAGEFATQASAYDTSTTTAATTTMATASSNYGNFFIFSNTVFSGIPSNATITGVELEVTDQVGTNNRSDQFYQLGTANGTLIGSEFQSDATTTKQVKTLTYANLGSPTVTRANLVSGTFGIRVRTLRSNTVTLSLFDLRMNVSYTVPGATTPIEVRALMGNPVGTLAAGVDTGKVRIRVRKLGSGSDPSVIAQLRDDAGNLLLDNVIPSTAVSAGDPGTVLEGTFNQNVLTAGKDSVCVCVMSTGASGGLVEVGAVNWEAEDALDAGGPSPVETTLSTATAAATAVNIIPTADVLLQTADAPATGVVLTVSLDVPLQTGAAAATGITLIPTADVPLQTASAAATGDTLTPVVNTDTTLQTATAAATADTTTVVLGSDITLATAEAAATGVVLIPTADVPLQTASAAATGVATALSLDVLLQTASASAVAETLIPTGDVLLQTASAAAAGVTTTVNIDVPLQTPAAATAGITATVNIDVPLQTASVAATGDVIVPVQAGQTTLQTAEVAASAIPLTVSMSIPLQTASSAAAGDALTVAMSVPLQTASAAAAGDTLTVTSGLAAVSTTLQTASVAAASPTSTYPDAALYPGATLYPSEGLSVVVTGVLTTIPLQTASAAATAGLTAFAEALTPDERRLYVKFEDRSILVAFDNRIRLVPNETRTAEVAYEPRTNAVPYENRRLVR